MPDVCAVCNRVPDAACRDYHCPTHGAQAAIAASGMPSLTDRVTPPQPDIRLVLEQLPHALPGGLIGNTVEQGPPYNLYEPRARIAAAVCRRGASGHGSGTGAIRVFEFGALLGYGLCALVGRRPPGSVVGWVDNESHTPGSNATCEENVRSLGVGDVWWGSDRRESPSFVSADVVLIDGDHSYEAAMDDIAYAYRLRPRLIMIDDHIEAHAGVIAAVATITDPKVRIPTVNGLVVVRPRKMLATRTVQRGLESLAEQCGLEWEPVR